MAIYATRSTTSLRSGAAGGHKGTGGDSITNDSINSNDTGGARLRTGKKLQKPDPRLKAPAPPTRTRTRARTPSLIDSISSRKSQDFSAPTVTTASSSPASFQEITPRGFSSLLRRSVSRLNFSRLSSSLPGFGARRPGPGPDSTSAAAAAAATASASTSAAAASSADNSSDEDDRTDASSPEPEFIEVRKWQDENEWEADPEAVAEYEETRQTVPGFDQWGEDEERLYKLLSLRGHHPLMPHEWSSDFLGWSIPDLIFAPPGADKPVVIHNKSNQFRATKALQNLFELASRVNGCRQAGNNARVPLVIEQHIEKYIRWAMTDAGLDKHDFYPNIGIREFKPISDDDPELTILEEADEEEQGCNSHPQHHRRHQSCSSEESAPGNTAAAAGQKRSAHYDRSTIPAPKRARVGEPQRPRSHSSNTSSSALSKWKRRSLSDLPQKLSPRSRRAESTDDLVATQYHHEIPDRPTSSLSCRTDCESVRHNNRWTATKQLLSEQAAQANLLPFKRERSHRRQRRQQQQHRQDEAGAVMDDDMLTRPQPADTLDSELPRYVPRSGEDERSTSRHELSHRHRHHNQRTRPNQLRRRRKADLLARRVREYIRDFAHEYREVYASDPSLAHLTPPRTLYFFVIFQHSVMILTRDAGLADDDWAVGDDNNPLPYVFTNLNLSREQFWMDSSFGIAIPVLLARQGLVTMFEEQAKKEEAAEEEAEREEAEAKRARAEEESERNMRENESGAEAGADISVPDARISANDVAEAAGVEADIHSAKSIAERQRPTTRSRRGSDPDA